MASLKKPAVRSKRRHRGRAILINAEKYQRRQGFMTAAGPWALLPHADEETFWPSPVGAAKVTILNADGSLREVVDAVTFKRRGQAGKGT